MNIESKKKFYINGQWVEPLDASEYKVINPSNEEVCAIISLGGKEDTNAAVKAAKDSFIKWWNISRENKLDLLNKLLMIF